MISPKRKYIDKASEGKKRMCKKKKKKVNKNDEKNKLLISSLPKGLHKNVK